jgi:WhiB family transcriptional regulator, redox-sensing transcriptional regulator
MAGQVRIAWDESWRPLAACKGEDASFFFAPGYFERRQQKDDRERKAKALCARCEVREECLEYALGIREGHGVWGGLNEMERRAVLRQRDLRERELRAG